MIPVFVYRPPTRPLSQSAGPHLSQISDLANSLLLRYPGVEIPATWVATNEQNRIDKLTGSTFEISIITLAEHTGLTPQLELSVAFSWHDHCCFHYRQKIDFPPPPAFSQPGQDVELVHFSMCYLLFGGNLHLLGNLERRS
jgi:hypothetical protein